MKLFEVNGKLQLDIAVPWILLENKGKGGLHGL